MSNFSWVKATVPWVHADCEGGLLSPPTRVPRSSAAAALLRRSSGTSTKFAASNRRVTMIWQPEDKSRQQRFTRSRVGLRLDDVYRSCGSSRSTASRNDHWRPPRSAFAARPRGGVPEVDEINWLSYWLIKFWTSNRSPMDLQ